MRNSWLKDLKSAGGLPVYCSTRCVRTTGADSHAVVSGTPIATRALTSDWRMICCRSPMPLAVYSVNASIVASYCAVWLMKVSEPSW